MLISCAVISEESVIFEVSFCGERFFAGRWLLSTRFFVLLLESNYGVCTRYCIGPIASPPWSLNFVLYHLASNSPEFWGLLCSEGVEWRSWILGPNRHLFFLTLMITWIKYTFLLHAVCVSFVSFSSFIVAWNHVDSTYCSLRKFSCYCHRVDDLTGGNISAVSVPIWW